MNQNTTNTFNPEIRTYFELNGFQEPVQQPIAGGLLFLKNDELAVQFWHDRIEVRRGFNFQLTHSYKGFDGQDIFELMMLMHFMRVVSLAEVRTISAMETFSIKQLLKEAV